MYLVSIKKIYLKLNKKKETLPYFDNYCQNTFFGIEELVSGEEAQKKGRKTILRKRKSQAK